MKETSVSCPPRVNLAYLPTPLHPLPRLSAKLGVDLFMKREDLTGGIFGLFPKAREIEPLLS